MSNKFALCSIRLFISSLSVFIIPGPTSATTWPCDRESQAAEHFANKNFDSEFGSTHFLSIASFLASVERGEDQFMEGPKKAVPFTAIHRQRMINEFTEKANTAKHVPAVRQFYLCAANFLKAGKKTNPQPPKQQRPQQPASKTFVLFDQFLGNRCGHVPAKTKAWFVCREPYFRDYIRGCGQLEDPDGSYPVARLREIMACGDKNYLRNQGTAARQGKISSRKTAPDGKKTLPADNQCAKQTGRVEWGIKITNVCSENIYFYWCYKKINPMSDQDRQSVCRPHKIGWGPGTSYHTQGLSIAPGGTINVGILNSSFTFSAVACKFSKGLPFLTGISGNTSKGVCAKPS